eukprot:519693-Pleurochrysis_carterae.AAC.2
MCVSSARLVGDADRVRHRHDERHARVDQPPHPAVDFVTAEQPARQLERRHHSHALVAVQRPCHARTANSRCAGA